MFDNLLGKHLEGSSMQQQKFLEAYYRKGTAVQPSRNKHTSFKNDRQTISGRALETVTEGI
jgi:hypothetical protein